MARILVTGASGLLGAAVLAAASDRHQVTGQFHRHEAAYPGVGMVRADLTQEDQCDALVLEARPDWIIHCAAATDVDRCEGDRGWARKMNRDLPRRVADRARDVGARLAHISTDAVFDGRGGPYGEEDAPDPVNVYGRSKWEGERAVAETLPSALIIRTNFYGWNIQPKLSLAEWFLQHLRSGQPCPGFMDVEAAPLLANDLAAAILEMLDRDLGGTFHLGSPECVSKFEFGRRVAATFGLDETLIRPVSVEDIGLPARRPRRLCLAVEKAERILRRSLPDISDGLIRFRALGEAGYVKRFQVLTEVGHGPAD